MPLGDSGICSISKLVVFSDKEDEWDRAGEILKDITVGGFFDSCCPLSFVKMRDMIDIKGQAKKKAGTKSIKKKKCNLC